jgi:hypothetical protein
MPALARRGDSLRAACTALCLRVRAISFHPHRTRRSQPDRLVCASPPPLRPPPRSKRKLYNAFSELLAFGVTDDKPQAIFCRWLEFVQLRVANREISHLLRAKRKLEIKRRWFAALKREVTGPVLGERTEIPYVLRQKLASLDTWKHKFLMPRPESVWRRRLHAWQVRQRKLRARTPELRTMLDAFREEVVERLAWEAKLLFAWSTKEFIDSKDATMTVAFVPAMLQLRRHVVLRTLRRCETLAIIAADADLATIVGERAHKAMVAEEVDDDPAVEESAALQFLNRVSKPPERPAIGWRTSYKLHRWAFNVLAVELVQLPAAELRAASSAAALRSISLSSSARYWDHILELMSSAKGLTRKINNQALVDKVGVGLTTARTTRSAAGPDGPTRPATGSASQRGARPGSSGGWGKLPATSGVAAMLQRSNSVGGADGGASAGGGVPKLSNLPGRSRQP